MSAPTDAMKQLAATRTQAQSMTEAEPLVAAEGCTEFTCLQHGPFNEARRMLGVRP